MLGSKRVNRLQKRSAAVSEAKAVVSTKAAIYIRVSTEEQAEHGYGIDSQTRACKAFAASQSYELSALETDAAISGATRPADRDAFARLLALAAEKRFAVLVVYKFDRLARNIGYSIEAVGQLDALGVVIRSVTEPIDTGTPMGRTIFAIFAGMAEQERQTITERTHGGRREKALKGGYACGVAPMGYRADQSGQLVVDEAGAVIVNRIFAMRREGMILRDIAAKLTADKVPTKRGGTWRPSQVAYILDNPRYFGRVEYLFRLGTETHVLRKGKHKAIVTGALTLSEQRS